MWWSERKVRAMGTLRKRHREGERVCWHRMMGWNSERFLAVLVGHFKSSLTSLQSHNKATFFTEINSYFYNLDKHAHMLKWYIMTTHRHTQEPLTDSFKHTQPDKNVCIPSFPMHQQFGLLLLLGGTIWGLFFWAVNVQFHTLPTLIASDLPAAGKPNLSSSFQI